MTAPEISAIVLAFRNEATVAEAVASLLPQAGNEVLEVILVASGGDRSGRIVRERFPDVRVVEVAERLLPGAARNLGVEVSLGRVVSFLAADCVAEPGWVARRLATHRQAHAAVASSLTHHGPARPWSWASHYVLFGGRLPGRPPGYVVYPDPAAHSLSFTRPALDRVGPFDGDLRVGEDTFVAKKLRDHGLEVWFDPRIRTAHRSPRTNLQLVLTHYRRGARQARAEGPRPMRISTILSRFPNDLALRVRWTVITAWANGAGERWRVLLSIPWIVLARAASLIGRRVQEWRLSKVRR